jgi:penicillin-binding protein 1A
MSKKGRKIKQLLIIGFIIIIAIGMGATIGAVTWVIQQSPDISDYGQWNTSESTTIYSANGERLTRLYRENRVYVPLSQIPKEMQQAVI